MAILVNKDELKGINFFNSFIEKARKGEQVGGSYIYRENIAERTSTNGQVIRYKYYYVSDMLKDSAEKLLQNIGKWFFKGSKESVAKISKTYETENIAKSYGADKKTWYQHIMEYFSHKSIWDKRFSSKENQEKFKKPIKQKVAEKVEVKGMETTAEKPAEIKTSVVKKEQKTKTWKPNLSLMRKIWSIYSVQGQRVEAEERIKDDNSDFVNNLEVATQACNKALLTKSNMLKKPIAQIQRIANGNTFAFDDYSSLDEYVAYLTKQDNTHKTAGIKEFYDYNKAGKDFAKIKNKEVAREIFSAYQNGEYELDTDGILQKKDTSAISEALKGNQNAKKLFSDLNDTEKTQKANQIKNNVITSIKSDSVPYDENKSVATLAKEWIENNPQGDANTVIGDVVINEKSAAHDLHHGAKEDSYLKLQTLPAVKDVLEKGTYLGYEKDYDGKPIDNHYFAGKIKYGNEEKIVFCRVRENAGDVNRFYVHEVFTEDELKKEVTMRTSNPSSLRLTGKPLYKFILQDVLNVNVKPQTDTELKAEKKDEKEARKEVGLPTVREDLGERTSLADDLSWNPNDENYRYKDTGYIAGARKELALSLIKRAGKEKTRLRDTDIDWEGVEENDRAAKEVITKSNIFGSVDWESLKSNGMTGGAAFLIDRVYSMIGKEPKDDNPTARRQYVIGLNGLRDRLETAKTVQDVENTLNEIGDEINGKFRSVRDTAEYKERSKKVDELFAKAKELKEKDRELWEKYCVEEAAARERENKRIRQFLIDKKAIKWNQKYYFEKEVAEKLTPNQRLEFENFKTQVHKEEFVKATELNDAYTKFRKDNEMGSKKYVYPDGGYIYIDSPIEKEAYDAGQSLSIWESVQGSAAVLSNPLYKAWYQLGDKFQIITQHAWKSKTFYQHKADARRGKYDDWEWLKKDTVEVSRQGQERKARFEFLVAKEYNRKGGRNVKAKSTQELKDLFNLRDVQSGNWVLKDPESAKFHVDRMAESFADLCDVTGIPDNLVSLNGRLAIAIGARGVGGENAAKAHYEPIERVINITKMKGGGSLAHEWFHAFDNMIMEAMGGSSGKSSTYMTNKYAHLTETQKKALQEYFKAKENNSGNEWEEYRLRIAAKKCEEKGVKIPESPKEQFQLKVAGAFDSLVKTMTEGDVPVFEKLTYTAKDWENAVRNIKADALNIGKQIYEAGNLENAMKIINGRFQNVHNKNRAEWSRMAAAYYTGAVGKKGGFAFVDLGKKGTSFLKEAVTMDVGGKDYWATTHEMAARAFSAYVDDKLRKENRFNDYLANYTGNKYYESFLDNPKPYPEGEERKQINGAFDELFRVVSEEKAIRKSLEIIDNDILRKTLNGHNNTKKSWCYFDKNGNLYFRKSTFTKYV